MPVKLSTTVNKISLIVNSTNIDLIKEFYEYLKNTGASEKHINNNLKAIMNFANYVDSSITFFDVQRREQIIKFLDTKIKTIEEDPDARWITTWNHYLSHINYFFRWLYNEYRKNILKVFLLLTIVIIIVIHLTMIGKHLHLFKLEKRRQKRISPYLEIELWERDELLCILKYESSKRNKAALALFWDLDARYHEITLLKIKHIRLKERYGEGEIPHEAKTGTGPVLLTCSFP